MQEIPRGKRHIKVHIPNKHLDNADSGSGPTIRLPSEVFIQRLVTGSHEKMWVIP